MLLPLKQQYYRIKALKWRFVFCQLNSANIVSHTSLVLTGLKAKLIYLITSCIRLHCAEHSLRNKQPLRDQHLTCHKCFISNSLCSFLAINKCHTTANCFFILYKCLRCTVPPRGATQGHCPAGPGGTSWLSWRLRSSSNIYANEAEAMPQSSQ